jgi:Entner-Doudoroff aldolase
VSVGDVAERRIREGRLVAIIRLPETGQVEAIAEVLVRAGIRAIEVTFDSPGAIHAIRVLARRFGREVAVGAGTVMTTADVLAAQESGATFCVSPHMDPEIVRSTIAAGLLAIPGAFTAGEVVAACRAGAGMVKLFPSDPAGVAYLRALRGPLPNVPFIPTGGIRIDAVRDYLAAGAIAVGLGSSLVSADASLDGIKERAGRAIALAREAHVA